jgi:alpha-L-rhamnosidase
MVIGPGDIVDASTYPWGWEQENYQDSSWLQVKRIASPVPAGYGSDNLWTLAPRNIPQMRETMQRISNVRRAKGMDVANDFLDGKHPLTIPADTTVSILLDQAFNTVAYPELVASKGRGFNCQNHLCRSLVCKGWIERKPEPDQ